MQNAIKLEFTLTTPQQAHHMVEAYAEAMSFVTHEADGVTVLQQGASERVTMQQYVAGAGLDVNGEAADQAAAAGKVDGRGVPFHGDYHSGKIKDDGTWGRRRNHNKALADAFEAPYLAPKPPSGAAPLAPQTVATTGNIAAPTPSATSVTTAPTDGTWSVPSATPQPAAPYVPTVEEYKAKWVDLCQKQQVTGEHQKFIETTFKHHPCDPALMAIEANRLAIWAHFENWANGVKGF
jgi:hypothetical protein